MKALLPLLFSFVIFSGKINAQYSPVEITDFGETGTFYCFGFEPQGDYLYFFTRFLSGTNRYHIYKKHRTTEEVTYIGNLTSLGVTPYDKFYTFGNHLYFTGSTSASGKEVWRLDVETNVVEQFTDIATMWAGSEPRGYTILNGELYFFANRSNDRQSLWKTDGTVEGTQLVKQFNTIEHSNTNHLFYSYGGRMVAYNNALYITAVLNDGTRLFKSDGTSEGTVLFYDFGNSVPIQVGGPLWVFQDKLFLGARDTSHGYEFWTTDGTIENLQLFADLNPGTNSYNGSFHKVIGENFYITSSSNQNYFELWICDGTPEGLRRIESDYSGIGISSSAKFDNHFFFVSQAQFELASYLLYHPKDSNTFHVVDLGVNYLSHAFMGDNKIYSDNGNLYFSASLEQNSKLYKLEPTNPALSNIETNIQDISVYPNPSADDITVNAGEQIITEYSIFDFAGKIYQQKSNLFEHQLQLTLPNDIGIYFLKIITDDGEKIFKISKIN